MIGLVFQFLSLSNNVCLKHAKLQRKVVNSKLKISAFFNLQVIYDLFLSCWTTNSFFELNALPSNLGSSRFFLSNETRDPWSPR